MLSTLWLRCKKWVSQTFSAEKKITDLIAPREHLNDKARGVRAFKYAFRRAYRVGTDDIRQLAANKASFNFTAFDWTGYGVISASAIIADSLIATLAFVGIMTGAVSLGIGLGVALLGLGASMAFNIYRDRQKEKKYKSVANYLDDCCIDQRILFVRDKVLIQFADTLNHCHAKVARMFAREIIDIVTQSMLHEDVRHLKTFINAHYMQLYQNKLTEIIQRENSVSRAKVKPPVVHQAVVSTHKPCNDVLFAPHANFFQPSPIVDIQQAVSQKATPTNHSPSILH